MARTKVLKQPNPTPRGHGFDDKQAVISFDREEYPNTRVIKKTKTPKDPNRVKRAIPQAFKDYQTFLRFNREKYPGVKYTKQQLSEQFKEYKVRLVERRGVVSPLYEPQDPMQTLKLNEPYEKAVLLKQLRDMIQDRGRGNFDPKLFEETLVQGKMDYDEFRSQLGLGERDFNYFKKFFDSMKNHPLTESDKEALRVKYQPSLPTPETERGSGSSGQASTYSIVPTSSSARSTVSTPSAESGLPEPPPLKYGFAETKATREEDEKVKTFMEKQAKLDQLEATLKDLQAQIDKRFGPTGFPEPDPKKTPVHIEELKATEEVREELERGDEPFVAEIPLLPPILPTPLPDEPEAPSIKPVGPLIMAAQPEATVVPVNEPAVGPAMGVTTAQPEVAAQAVPEVDVAHAERPPGEMPGQPDTMGQLTEQGTTPVPSGPQTGGESKYAVKAVGVLRDPIHPVPLALFFGDAHKPAWDVDLAKTIDSLTLSREEINQGIDGIIGVNGPKIMIPKRLRDGDHEEYKEVVELHFCLERHMSKGTRAPMAIIPLAKLEALRAGLNQQSASSPPASGPPATSPQAVTDSGQPTPNPMGLDQGGASLLGPQRGIETLSPPHPGDSGTGLTPGPPLDNNQIQVTPNQADERLDLAIRNRTRDWNGKPIIIKEFESGLKVRQGVSLFPAEPGSEKTLGPVFGLSYAKKPSFNFRFKENNSLC